MNIDEEKQHIYSMMREITKERRQLTEIYYQLKARLDELDKLERMGIQNMPVKGYVDLFNNSREKILNEAINETVKPNTDIKIDRKENSIISKKEIEEYKDRKQNVNNLNDVNKIIGIIISVLKEEGKELKLKTIYEKVSERYGRYIRYGNFQTNIMPTALKRNSKIQKVARGIYKYKNE